MIARSNNCPMCGYEVEKDACGNMICENPNCKLDREEISPTCWRAMQEMAQFIRDLAKDTNRLDEKNKSLIEERKNSTNLLPIGLAFQALALTTIVEKPVDKIALFLAALIFMMSIERKKQ